ATMVPRLRNAIVSLTDGRQIEAALVVGADGRNSAVRQHLAIAVRTWRYGQKALVFNVWHGRPHDGVSTEIHRSGGPFTLVPLPDHEGKHRSAVVWMETGAHADELFRMPQDAFEERLNRRSCGILGGLKLASPRRIWPIIAQEAERLAGPRAVLIAEASHVIPPIGAQGLNMSLRDIACLRDLLVQAREAGTDFGAPDVLNSYARNRRTDIAVRIRGVDMLNRMAMAETPALRDLRRAGLHFLHETGPLRRAAMVAGLGARG
ncbi:MAG: FAD-dependent monooxygenase, partial [Paracoccaceae bacterium]